MASDSHAISPLKLSTILGFETGLGAIGLWLAWLGLYDPSAPLWPTSPRWELGFNGHWVGWILLGLLATVPLVVMLIVFELIRWKPLRQFRQTYVPLLQTMFGQMTLFQLVLVAIAAGIGEELLFRWSFQGGLAHFGSNWYGGGIIAIAVASILFGLAHFLSWTYLIWATAVGVYFGVIFQVTGNWVIPALAHGLYDFIALVYLTRFCAVAENIDLKISR